MDTLPSMEPFQLVSRLAADTFVIGDFPLCRLLLMDDAQYRWFILVPRVAGVEEIYQLSEEDQQQMIWESSYVAEKLKDIFSADKMNIGALGNQVRQLHIHHIVRYQNDPAWPGPVWGHQPPKPYGESEVHELQARLKMVFTTYLKPSAESPETVSI